jgi:hypothetical protein
MMISDNGYVIKNSDGLYFTGYNQVYNQVSNQLRKAKIYHSIRYANDSANELNTNPRRLPGVKNDFVLVKIIISEVE